MSPILKRDVSEQLRHAKRLATAFTGLPLENQGESSRDGVSYAPLREEAEELVAGSSSSRSAGIGVEDAISQSQSKGGRWKRTRAESKGRIEFDYDSDEGNQQEEGFEMDRRTKSMDQVGVEDGYEHSRMLNGGPNGYPLGRIPSGKMRQMKMVDGEDHPPIRMDRMRDLRNLLFESTPCLLLSLVGLVFTGELLEHLARWRVFRRVDELFILVPMLGNLKGNLEMCLSARLGTSANMGELDHRKTRRALMLANMTLLGLQALLIASLAGVISFILGLIAIHRLGDTPSDPLPIGTIGNTTTPLDPGLAVGEQDFHEGYTRPGWKQLVMVLATGMGAAGISSAVLGSFMSSLVVVSRRAGLDPDNITPPLAACLGDLITLFLLALLGTVLVGAMDTPIPLVAVLVMGVAAAWFTRRVMRNAWVKSVAKGGWVPLIGAMLISSGTGMVLDRGVGKYRGFALLAISMTGLTGAIGAIHANRLSTLLHLNLHPNSLNPRPARYILAHLSPLQAITTLYLIAIPCQAAFLLFVSWAGWIDLSLGWAGWLAFGITTAVSLSMAHVMTLLFWGKGLDPDSYTLPIHSALVDFLGQLLLMIAYEICISQGKDVLVRDSPL